MHLLAPLALGFLVASGAALAPPRAELRGGACPDPTDADGDGFDLCTDCDDTRADGLDDVCDNCRYIYNPAQEDGDLEGAGDACDAEDGLIFVMLFDAASVDWQLEAGHASFNLYRGDLEVLLRAGIYTQDPIAVPLALRACDLVVASLPDVVTLRPGQATFYLVTGRVAGVEESLGADSGGRERPNDNPCS